MIFRLLFNILIIFLIVLFAALNASHTTDVSLGFHVFKNVPVFLSGFVAFMLGIVFMNFFSFLYRGRKKKEQKKLEKKFKHQMKKRKQEEKKNKKEQSEKEKARNKKSPQPAQTESSPSS